MVDTELTKREKVVLSSVVEEFVASATPVGSSKIVNHFSSGISSATIRNVMLGLEGRGYLAQPHISAGRMPTDKGYRVYVDSMMPRPELPETTRRKIRGALSRASSDVEYILESASSMLAQISNQLGVVLAPRFYQGVFEKIDLVPITENRILVVLSICSGLVRSITVELNKSLSRAELDRTARFINERLHGLTLKEIKQTIDKRLRGSPEGDSEFIEGMIRSSESMFSFAIPSDVHLGGAANIMEQPEFEDKSRLARILNLIDDKEILVHILDDEEKPDRKSGDLRIVIGAENKDELAAYCSLITATYTIGGVTGTVGVIGPTRMHYAKMVALVRYTAEALSGLFSKTN
ncbi:MAG TPA: heat-inducible transcription repressor HrcA [Bacteroidetes bacterium]|nr:heat-inducible transcription repressor HrcA [Bacteroidota bacterium]